MEARMATEPGFHSRVFVGAIVVHDQMEIEHVGCLGVDLLEKSNELLMPMTRHAVADNLAVEHVQCRKQCCGAIAFVIVGHRPATAFLQGKARLGAVEGLNLTFFVDTQHQGSVWWIDIEPNNVEELLEEMFVATEFERFDQMGLEVVLLPYPTYRCLAQTLCVGHGSCAPVRRIGRWCMESCFDHSLDFPLRDSRNTTRTGGIFFQASASQGYESLPPELNSGTRDPQLKSDLVDEDSRSCHLDDLSALDQAQREALPPRPALEGFLFVGGEYNAFCCIHWE